MQLTLPKRSKPKDTIIDIDNFSGGTMTQVDEARLDKKFASQSLNLIQVQDGRWKTRWGFDYFGVAISGESAIDGAVEYIRADGTRELIVVGGTTGKIWKSTNNGASWSQIDTETLTPGNTAYFLQIKSNLYISNGVDDLHRYDGTNVEAYSAISAPANLAASRGAGLSAGVYTLYYEVTALNAIGETVGSNEASIAVDKFRDSWSTADDSTEYVDLAWDAVSGATRYNVYVSEESGYEVFLTTTTTNSYRDNNTATPNDYIEVPLENTTAAPKFGPMELSGNRIWGTKNPDSPFTVYGTGTGQQLGNFSGFYGGFSVDLEKGGRERPVSVVHYRTGKGDPIATILTETPEGTGSIWQIELTTTTVGDFSFIVPVTYKIVGGIGTNAPLSVTKARDNIFFANKRGVFALRNKEQLFNVLSTDELSQAWRPNYRSLNADLLPNACGYYLDGKVFFSFAEGSANDITVIFDLERNNWNYKWSRGVKRFFEYTDTAGNTHFLAIPTSGGRLWEISENFLGDFGAPFNQSYVSPLIPVSKDSTDVLKTREALVELGRPRGNVTFSISGIEAKRGFSSLGSRAITDSVSGGGYSWDLFSNVQYSDTTGTPTTFSQASIKKTLRIRKRVYALQYQVSSTSANTDFTILKFQTKGRLLNKRTPSAWRN